MRITINLLETFRIAIYICILNIEVFATENSSNKRLSRRTYAHTPDWATTAYKYEYVWHVYCCMYVYTCILVYVYAYVCIYVYIWHVYTYMYVYTCISNMYIGVCIYIYVCIYLYIWHVYWPPLLLLRGYSPKSPPLLFMLHAEESRGKIRAVVVRREIFSRSYYVKPKFGILD